MDPFDFKSDVLELSNTTPVLVDFWAPWCGPCRFLGPVIEELSETATNWQLVKVNTDEHPDLMEKYQIRGIPAVKMFYQENVVAEFTGALPKHQIEKWISDNLPDPRNAQLEELKEALSSSDPVNGLDQLVAFVDQNPDLEEGRILLAENLIWTKPVDSLALVSVFRIGSKYFERAENIRSIASFLECDLGDESKVATLIEGARDSFKAGDIDQTLKKLVEAVSLDKEFCQDLARKAIIALFNIFGSDNELTQKYRRQFDMALY